MAFEYGVFPAMRRHVRPGVQRSDGPIPRFETSYQHSYCEQVDAPRACSTTIERVPPRRQPLSSIDAIIEQSGTTAGDFVPTTRSSFSHHSHSGVKVVIEKIQNPKPRAPVFPQKIERTKVRGK